MKRVGDGPIPDGGASRSATLGTSRQAPRDSAHTRLARWAISRPKSTKRQLMLAADALMLPLTLWIAIALRQGEPVSPVTYGSALFWAGLFGITLFSLFGLYRSVTRFTGVRVVGRIAVAVVLCACALALIDRASPGWHVRYSILPIFCAFAVLLVAGSRVLARYLCLSGLKNKGRKRIAIYGAGQAGARTSRFLMGGPEFNVVAFVDDLPALHGRQINGIPVYPPADLPTLVITRRIDRVLIAMPSVSHRRRREVLADLEPLGVHVQSLPDLGDIISGRARIDEVRDVDAADLLGRDPVPPNPELLERCIRGKNVLVTEIGRASCRERV